MQYQMIRPCRTFGRFDAKRVRAVIADVESMTGCRDITNDFGPPRAGRPIGAAE